MILLDTNVLSEAMRVEPDGRVMRWLDRHAPSILFLSAVTVDEVLFGIEILPPGRQRARLGRAFSKIVDGSRSASSRSTRGPPPRAGGFAPGGGGRVRR